MTNRTIGAHIIVYYFKECTLSTTVRKVCPVFLGFISIHLITGYYNKCMSYATY